MPIIKRHCAHVNAEGHPCLAAPMHGSPYCYYHNPEIAEQRYEAQMRGGYNSRRYVDLGDVQPPATAQEATQLMSRVLSALACGKLDPKIANAMSIAVQTFVKTLDLTEIELRIEQLGNRIKELERCLQ